MLNLTLYFHHSAFCSNRLIAKNRLFHVCLLDSSWPQAVSGTVTQHLLGCTMAKHLLGQAAAAVAPACSHNLDDNTATENYLHPAAQSASPTDWSLICPQVHRQPLQWHLVLHLIKDLLDMPSTTFHPSANWVQAPSMLCSAMTLCH
jgi:hypothetical protein